MGHTCLSVFALCVILLTFVAIAISFSVPEWLVHGSKTSSGLWLDCALNENNIRWDSCRWYFSNNFALQHEKAKSYGVWFVAVQVLYSCALGFSVFAVLAATCTCICRSNRANSITCGLINFTFLLLVAAVATFGAMQYTKHGVRHKGSAKTFGWAFWTAVGSTGGALMSTILYYCLSRVEDYGAGYKD